MKKIVVYVLASILLLGLGGVGSYFCCNNMNKVNSDSSDKKDVNKEIKVETIDSYDDLVVKTIKDLEIYGLIIGPADKTGYKGLFRDTKVNAKELDQFYVYNAVGTKYFDNKSAITEEDWNKTVSKLFGDDFKFDKSIAKKNQICIDHYYDEKTGKYEYQQTACGWITGPNGLMKYFITKAEKRGNNLIINLRTFFPGDTTDLDKNGHVKYYKNSTKTDYIQDLVYMQSESKDRITDTPIFEDYEIAKGGIYEFTFEKNEDESYHFVSSEYLK